MFLSRFDSTGGRVNSPFYGPNFAPNTPPYMINNCGNGCPLRTKTVDADAVHYGQMLEYDVHNLYGAPFGDCAVVWDGLLGLFCLFCLFALPFVFRALLTHFFE